MDSDMPARPAGREGADSLLAGGAPAWRGPWLTGPIPGVAPPAAEDEDRMAAIVRRVGPAGAPAGGLQAFQQPNERVLTSAPAQPTPSGGLKRARLGHDDSAGVGVTHRAACLPLSACGSRPFRVPFAGRTTSDTGPALLAW